MLSAIYPIIDIVDEQDCVNSAIDYARELFVINSNLDNAIIQLRAKNLSESSFLQIAQTIINVRNQLNSPVRIIINDSIKVCIDANANGVHLGQDDESPLIAKNLLAKKSLKITPIIGLSTHSKEQVLLAPFNLLTYCALGPIFHSPTKSGHAKEVGLSTLSECAKLCPIPLVAIGGITLKTAQSVYKAGAASIALISDLGQSKDRASKIKEYLKAYCVTQTTSIKPC